MTQTYPALHAIADALYDAERTRMPIAPVRDAIAQAAIDHEMTAIEAAYLVQKINHERRETAGGRLVGRKIGLTSKVVQHQLGVDEPDYGLLWADMACGDGEEIAIERTLQPKAEGEIALVLEHDLNKEQHTYADIIRATAFAVPAIEIVGSRIQNWDIRLVDTVADNASSGLFVLGSRPVALSKIDLVHCGMRLDKKGEPVSVGAGAACLGNPMTAAVWLADQMVKMGTPLQAGDVVLCGALGPMVPVSPGDVWTLEIEGMGMIRAAFTQGALS